MRLRTGRDQSKQFIVDGAQAIRDGAFIIIAWALFVAAMLYPVLQIVGLLICALLLLRGGGERDWRSRDRVLKARPVIAGC